MTLTLTLGWTLLHFVWQGTLIAALLAVALAFLRQTRSTVRYAMSCAAMLLMFLCASATFLNLRLAAPAPYPVLSTLGGFTSAAAVAIVRGSEATKTLSDYLPLFVWAWFGGVCALSIRSLGGWFVAQRFAKLHANRAEEPWEDRFVELTRRLAIERPVRLAVSALAEVPAAIGWLRPVVLVPAGVFLGLSAEQVEALLAHELAHIRRHDYLVNLFQTAIETLLFYHPAVWWVSRIIRVERENCCDDLAVEICGNPLSYARALTELEELRSRRNVPGLAMAADGGSLVHRVQRLLRLRQGAPAASSSWLAILAILAGLSVVGVAVNAWAQRPEKAPDSPASASQPAAAVKETTPKAIWLDEIEAAGLRNLSVDQLIELKIQGVTGEYIREMHANGFDLTPDQLVAFRIHEVTAGFISEMKKTGLGPLNPDNLVELRIHSVEPAWIREIQGLGLAGLTVDNVIALRIHEITSEFIRDARRRFKDISVDQLIELKIHGILAANEPGSQDPITASAEVQKVLRHLEKQVRKVARTFDPQ